MKLRKTKLILGSVLVLALAVLLLTCPGKRAHREALVEAIGDEIVKEAELNTQGDAAASFKEINENFYNSAVSPYLKVLGYGIFSIGYLEVSESRQKVSFGILGMVFVKDRDHIAHKVPLLRGPAPINIEESAQKS